LISTFIYKKHVKFLKEINTIHPSIKFEAQKSKEEINFLDTTVYIKNNRLLTKLYRKPTDRQSYLNNKSYHPNSTKRGIPYSQALRMKRICSEQDELKKNLDHLKLTLLSRGYAKDHIDTQFQKVMSTKREDTLKYKSKEQSKHRTLSSSPTTNKCQTSKMSLTETGLYSKLMIIHLGLLKKIQSLHIDVTKTYGTSSDKPPSKTIK